jgi:Cu2+-exporting ATPase
VDAVSEPGQGVEALVNGQRYRIGRPSYALALSNADLPDAAVDWLESGDTVVMLADSALAVRRFSGSAMRSVQNHWR